MKTFVCFVYFVVKYSVMNTPPASSARVFPKYRLPQSGGLLKLSTLLKEVTTDE